MAARLGRKSCELQRVFSSLLLNSSYRRLSSTYQIRTWLRTAQKSSTCIQQLSSWDQTFVKAPEVCLPVRRSFSTTHGDQVEDADEPDELYRQIDVEVKGHDPAVLNSYQKFVTLTAEELDINIGQIFTPPKVITRRTLLKSVHIFKKHRVQYEWRTHFRVFEFKHLTGSTADTFLEYIQRNLPEGVAMKVTRYRLEELPAHIVEAIQESRGKPKDHEPPLS